MAYAKELRIMADLEGFVQEDSAKMMLNIDRRVVIETPFDKGSAKIGWIASTGNSSSQVIDVGEGVELSVAQMTAIDQGAAVITGAKAWDNIYLTNNQPHIVPLNEGWSEQAPSKYVDTIIEQEVAHG